VPGGRHEQHRFEALYRATYPDVFAYCRRRLPASDVSDTIADIYAVAWRKRDDFIGADSPLAWLYGVGFRVISSRYRSTKRRRRLSRRLATEPVASRPGVETIVAADAEVARAFDALAGLSAKDRELIRLAAFEELSYDQIATVMGLSRNAVRSSLFRARERLREAWESGKGDAP
jgi:RNA polymerase sigma factor (sigma-70 family)